LVSVHTVVLNDPGRLLSTRKGVVSDEMLRGSPVFSLDPYQLLEYSIIHLIFFVCI